MRYCCKKRFLLICLVFRKFVSTLSSSSPFQSSSSSSLSSSTTATNTSSFRPDHKNNKNDTNTNMKLLHKESTNHILGKIYTNREAAIAFRKQKLNSKLNASIQRIRLVFLNETDEPLILCWVHENGNLHHYYKLKPCGSPIFTCLDRHGFQTKTLNSHLEHTFLGHAFVLGTTSEEDAAEGGGNHEEREEETAAGDAKGRIGNIIAGYQPLQVSLVPVEDAGLCVHVIRIIKRSKSSAMTMSMLRNRNKRDATTRAVYDLIVEQYEMDKTPIDTSNKVYDELVLGGWRCMCERGLFKRETDHASSESILCKVRKQLELDLEACSKKLPPEACKLLQQSVPFWINKSQHYGPKCAPIQGKGMCFHVHPDWLSRNGMSTKKCGGVEIYQAEKYLDDHGLWYGTGGGLLHELSHAWHNKFVPKGYGNEDIIACYEAAMKEKLYDCVKVHNRRGGTSQCRGYAATNAEEYFAELSVAFLGGVGDDADLEFNKWFPFNRKQLKEHDPRAYKMLFKVWGIQE